MKIHFWTIASIELTPELLGDEDEDKEVIVEGEVDKADIHIKLMFFSVVDV